MKTAFNAYYDYLKLRKEAIARETVNRIDTVNYIKKGSFKEFCRMESSTKENTKLLVSRLDAIAEYSIDTIFSSVCALYHITSLPIDVISILSSGICRTTYSTWNSLVSYDKKVTNSVIKDSVSS